MSVSREAFILCGELDRIPDQNRSNYLAEMDILTEELSIDAAVLQVGSMDGQRIIELLTARPDLRLTGLEIESNFVRLARTNITNAGVDAEIILGDITKPPTLSRFDAVLCLNNTLGYIRDYDKAIAALRRLGTTVMLSVYGEGFDDLLARTYFSSLGLSVSGIEDDVVSVEDFGAMRRFTRAEVASWGGRIREMPIGYLVTITAAA